MNIIGDASQTIDFEGSRLGKFLKAKRLTGDNGEFSSIFKLIIHNLETK